MLDYLVENWQVIVPLVAAAVMLFWPQTRPFIESFLKALGLNKPKEGEDVIDAVRAANRLADHFRKCGNCEGERLANEAAKAIFPIPEPVVVQSLPKEAK